MHGTGFGNALGMAEDDDLQGVRAGAGINMYDAASAAISVVGGSPFIYL
jgi:hypothetical protein